MRADGYFSGSLGGEAMLKFEGFGWHTPVSVPPHIPKFHFVLLRRGYEGRRFGS